MSNRFTRYKRAFMRLLLLSLVTAIGVTSGSVASAHILTPHTGNDNWHVTAATSGTCSRSVAHMDGDFSYFARAFATSGAISGTCTSTGSRIIGIYKGHDHPDPHHLYYASWSSGFDTFSSTPSNGWYYVSRSEHRANGYITSYSL